MKLRYLILETIDLKIKEIGKFSTNEGQFSYYDFEQPKGRSPMFTVLKSRQGYIIRNVIIPDELRRQGIATNFYKQMNVESLKKTKNPLRSTQPRKLTTGDVVHELSSDGEKLWDNLVSKGLAVKISDKNYEFKK